jgi:hypothetical protein
MLTRLARQSGVAFDSLLREAPGIEPAHLGATVSAASVSFALFALGASVLPLLITYYVGRVSGPWLAKRH